MQRTVLSKRLGLLFLAGWLAGCAIGREELASMATFEGDGEAADSAQAKVMDPEAAAADAIPIGEDASSGETAQEAAAPATAAQTDWPDNWQDMPVVPEVSDTARQTYRRGLEMGNDPNAFSVIVGQRGGCL